VSLGTWLDERLDLSGVRHFIAEKGVPVHTQKIWYYLGGMTLFLFGVQIFTGILLLLYYRPSASEAYESVQFIVTQVEFGWLIRNVHSWAANLLIALAFAHFFSVFFLKSYRKPRELTWLTGILLLFLMLGFGFSGYLLPWNELSFFATKVGTGIAGWRGRLPGVEPRPYIIRFTEDKPNPLYRRVCYTFAWSALVTYTVLNVAGLVGSIATGEWRLRQIYDAAYFPMAMGIWGLGAVGWLPRVKSSTKGEGHERRYFYGTVWAVCWAQPTLWLMWKVLPRTRVGDSLKLVIFVGILAFVGNLARLGRLPRTRPIVPGELAVSD